MKTRKFHLQTPTKLHRWFIYFLSVAFLVLALAHVFMSEMNFITTITIVVLLLNSVLLPLQTINRIVIDNNAILIKPDYLSSTRKFNWDEIEQIGLGSYLLEFQVKGKKKSVRTNTGNPSVSIAVKQAIREFAEEKNKAIEELTHQNS